MDISCSRDVKDRKARLRINKKGSSFRSQSRLREQAARTYRSTHCPDFYCSLTARYRERLCFPSYSNPRSLTRK